MSTQPLIFIHHDHGGGRLSRRSTKQVWTHVSRTTRHRKPRYLTIKLWKPSDGDAHYAETNLASKPRTITVPYGIFEWAYLSWSCTRSLKSPEDLRLVETVYLMLFDCSLKEMALRHSGDSKPYLKAKLGKYLALCSDLYFSLFNGIRSLQEQSIPRAFACFELASQWLQDCSVSGIFEELLPTLLSNFLGAMHQAQKLGANDIAKTFLRQFNALVTKLYGPKHRISVVSRTFIKAQITPILVLAGTQAQGNANPMDYQPTAVQQMLLTHKRSLLGAEYSIQEAEHAYSDLITEINKSTKPTRYDHQFASLAMAQVYIDHCRFADAAPVLSNAQSDLAEWVDEGYRVTRPRSAPLSVFGIIKRLHTLGQALAGMGDNEAADTMFRLAVSAGLKYLANDSPVLIEAQGACAKHLLAQGREEEAVELQRAMDSGLQKYMLKQSNIG